MTNTESRGTTGVVEAALPRALFRVRLEDGSSVVAALSTKAKRFVVKLLPGDEVSVRISRVDPSRARIESAP